MLMAVRFILHMQPVGYLLTNKFFVVFIMIFLCVNGLYGCCVFVVFLRSCIHVLIYVDRYI
jgi:hypothetical protein